jgi:hypothetical protein
MANQNFQSTSNQKLFRELTSLAAQWRRTGTCPDAAGVLSSGEYRALVFAAGRERELQAPVRDFLLLDGPMQRWVLETWGQPSLIGMTIAG